MNRTAPASSEERAAPRSRRAFERVVEAIRDGIQRGEIKIGDRLPSERDLAERFGVGRSSVREALRSLENSALLTLRRGPAGGAFVTSGDSNAVRTGMSDLLSLGMVKPEHLREARMIIGVAVARLAAERRSYADLQALQDNMNDLIRAVDGNETPERRASLGFEFHRLLAYATQNPALVVLTDSVIGLNEAMTRAAGLRNPKIGIQFRKRMLERIERCDGDAAAREMADYLEKLRRYYESKLRADV